MKRSRREFIGTGAALAAMSAARVRVADAQPAPNRGHRWDQACAWMKLSLAYFYAGGVRERPERVSMARQMGVLGGVAAADATSPRRSAPTKRWASSGRCWRASTSPARSSASRAETRTSNASSRRWAERHVCSDEGLLRRGVQRGPIRPDHVPTVTGFEENRLPGYNDVGALFAIGYIKGLMEAAMKA